MVTSHFEREPALPGCCRWGGFLRWTSGIKAKKNQFKRYIENNIVHASDICIIAISSIGMEEHHPFCFRSNSKEPLYALKVAYGIGGLYYDPEKNTIERSEMVEIEKPQEGGSVPISTAIFCDLAYEDVSAILAAKTSTYSSNYTEYVLIHNVNAKNKAPTNLFKVSEEWQAQASLVDGTYCITKCRVDGPCG